MSEFWHISRVCLRVRDLDTSIAFYHSVLGFDVDEGFSDLPRTERMITGLTEEEHQCSVLLSEGRPLPGLTSQGHFTLEAAEPELIDAIYERAVASDARATRPRTVRGRRQAFLFDPDGHKIEIIAREHNGDSHTTGSG